MDTRADGREGRKGIAGEGNGGMEGERVPVPRASRGTPGVRVL